MATTVSTALRLLAAAIVSGSLLTGCGTAGSDQDSGGTGKRSAGVPVDEVQAGGGIPWHQARDHAGTQQRVCGPLSGSGSSADDAFLNLGRNYPDPERFTIVLWDVGGVEPAPLGTTLCASGQITLYEGVAQIELRSIGAVEVHH